MSATLKLGVALACFAVVATANAGGYRYGVSDQAFYIPAVELRASPDLFPRDRAVIEPQMTWWMGDEVLGAVRRTTGIPLPALFGALQLVTLAAVALGALALLRALGGDERAGVVLLALLALRHRITKTGANSIEGYFHPRMLAFGLGLAAFAAVVRGRGTTAWIATIVAAIVHPSTAVWFAGAILTAQAWQSRRRWTALGSIAVAGALAIVALRIARPATFVPMGDTWLSVLESRDYLFSLEWPLYAWVANLGTLALLGVLARRHQRRGPSVPNAPGVTAGLLALVVGFLVTLPLNALAVPLFVQLQANRVFWLIDAVAVVYVALWLGPLGAARSDWRRFGVIGVVVILAIVRGWYVLAIETKRPLVEPTLPASAWTDVTSWLQQQPKDWHVLADPNHAALFGSSLRIAALRDTPLDAGKDPAMSMYDAPLAVRVAERTAALADFDGLTFERLSALDRTYSLDVFVDRTTRPWPLPVLYRNAEFVVYDLR